MQRYINMSFTLVFFGLVILWAGCGGPSTEVAPIGLTAEVEIPAGTSAADEARSVDVPDWFLNPPEDPNYMYAVAAGSSRDLQMSLDDAKQVAWTDLTSQLEVKVSGLFKRFREEVGAEEDSELLSMTTVVSKAVISETLNGAKVAKQDVKKEGNRYRSYMLMELPIGAMSAAVVDKVKSQKDMYTRFRASEGFKELEAEVEKYEEWKEEQGQG